VSRPLQVWSYGQHFPGRNMVPEGMRTQSRLLAAVPSRAAAARLFDTSSRQLATWGSESGNPHDVAVALSAPGTVFWQPLAARYKDGRSAVYVPLGEPWTDDATRDPVYATEANLAVLLGLDPADVLIEATNVTIPLPTLRRLMEEAGS
jgi:hypothetical protein